MASLLRKLSFSAILFFCISGTVALSGCTDEDRGDSDKPRIYKEIEILYESLSLNSNCNEMIALIKEYKNTNEDDLKVACEDYTNDRAKAKSVKPLITTWNNAGYNLAAFILNEDNLEKLRVCVASSSNEQADMRSQAKEAYKGLFTDVGCEQFLTDANDVVNDRN